MSSDTPISDVDLYRKMVYLAYRDIFRNKLAKLRKRSKIRNIVEKHQDHFHHKQLADLTDLEDVCKILGNLLAARIFESEIIAEVAFPTLFHPRKSGGDDTALIVKCVEDGLECETRQKVGSDSDARPSLDIFRDRDIHVPPGASQKGAPPVRQHLNDIKSGQVGKATRTTTNMSSTIFQDEHIMLKEASLEDPEKSRKVLKRKRDCDITPTNPTYLPTRLQHLILTQTQRLLEECCYSFAAKWFPSMLETNSWDASEAVELNKWWKAFSKNDIPPIATTLGQDESLVLLFRRVMKIRHCAVHRRPQIPVDTVKEMIRDAWSLSQALQDDLRSTRLLHWCRELENLVKHLELRTNSLRDAAAAELCDIQIAKCETEAKLAELELRKKHLTRSLAIEGRTHRPVDVDTLRPLEKAFSKQASTKSLFVIFQDQLWQWKEDSIGMMADLKHATTNFFS